MEGMEVEGEVAEEQIGPMEQVFFEDSEDEDDDLENEDGPNLARHARCASHLLNNIATHDFEKILEKNPRLKRKHEKAIRRGAKLWNVQSKQKVDTLEDALGCAMVRPVVCRWNALYRAIERVCSVREKITVQLYENLGILDRLSNDDFEYMSEYLSL